MCSMKMFSKRLMFYIIIFSYFITNSQNEVDYTIIDNYLSKVTIFDQLLILLPHIENTDNIPAIFPLKDNTNFKITSAFGERFHPIERKRKTHNGIDIAASIGTLVVATADGYISNIQFSETGYGRNISIVHDYGYKTTYSHLSIILVSNNDFVKKGNVIGMVGSTGKSTGNHLHYEIIKNKIFVNPADYFFVDMKYKKEYQN